VGVQRQYTGTAGRIENAQVAVYLTYAAAGGHALIDRELYLPRCWIDDPDRLTEAGVPDDIDFATKPALAAGMLTRALHAGVPARWVAGDEVYGNDPGLRAECEAQRIGYVLAIGCDRRVPTAAGPVRADALVAGLPRWAWQQLSAGPGAKGERNYDWAWITLVTDSPAGDSSTEWSGATRPAVSWRSIAATPRRSCRYVNWSASPAVAGPSRSPSRPARVWPGSMSTRSAAGPRGDAGRCCR
jgi:SRSO17 transposase